MSPESAVQALAPGAMEAKTTGSAHNSFTMACACPARQPGVTRSGRR